MDTAITCPIGDGIEQGIGTINGTVDATHTLVADLGLNRGARGGVVQSHRTSTVRVSIRLGTHELIGKSD